MSQTPLGMYYIRQPTLTRVTLTERFGLDVPLLFQVFIVLIKYIFRFKYEPNQFETRELVLGSEPPYTR